MTGWHHYITYEYDLIIQISGGATTWASQDGRPRSLQVRFRVYLLTVKVAENEKDDLKNIEKT